MREVFEKECKLKTDYAVPPANTKQPRPATTSSTKLYSEVKQEKVEEVRRHHEARDKAAFQARPEDSTKQPQWVCGGILP